MFWHIIFETNKEKFGLKLSIFVFTDEEICCFYPFLNKIELRIELS